MTDYRLTDVPSEELHERAADGLCEVTFAIEEVDYNALMEKDLLRLIQAHRDLHEMTLHYRTRQHGREPGEDD